RAALPGRRADGRAGPPPRPRAPPAGAAPVQAGGGPPSAGRRRSPLPALRRRRGGAGHGTPPGGGAEAVDAGPPAGRRARSARGGADDGRPGPGQPRALPDDLRRSPPGLPRPGRRDRNGDEAEPAPGRAGIAQRRAAHGHAGPARPVEPRAEALRPGGRRAAGHGLAGASLRRRHMSFQTLWVGVSGLTAAQRAMEVTANNVANVNTDGYSRQRVELVSGRPVPGTDGSRGDGMRGTGVTVADVVRAHSDLADTAFRSESATQGSWSARSDIMSRAEQVLGPIGGGTPKALADFFGSWEELSLHPDTPAARQAVIAAGASLAGSFNSAASDLDGLKAGAGAQIRATVDDVNRLAAQVAKLNAGIADATNGQQSPNDLLDQRDRLLDQLSALTGATVRPGELGRVDVYIGSRTLVRGETVETLQASSADPATVQWQLGGDRAATGGKLGGLVDSAA